MKQILTALSLALLCQQTPFATFCHASKADHLVPVEESHGLLAKYERVCREKLLVSPGEIARFISLPGSASVETSVSVYQKRGKENSLAGEYWVTITQASKSLWEATQSNSNPDAIKIERLEAPLPQLVAQSVHDVWVRMLVRVKPALKSSDEVMVDSTREIFSASKPDGSMIEGQSSSSPGPNIKALTDIALSLVEYCDKPPAIRKKIADDIRKKAERVNP